MTRPSEELAAAVRKFVGQVSHWTPSRWAASSVSGLPRADVVHELIQVLADRAADAEGQPRRPVPRLANDLALTAQLRVVAADLVAAADAAHLSDAAAHVNQVRRTL